MLSAFAGSIPVNTAIEMASEESNKKTQELREPFSSEIVPADEKGREVDISLLRDSLAMTPWERMLANDDALNFAESLRAAMKKRHAESR